MPMMRLMICSAGTLVTAPSRFLVRKSQKILGQKKASMAAHIWSKGHSVIGCSAFGGLRHQNSQAAAVRTMRRAQWFLISFPMAAAVCVRAERNELKERTSRRPTRRQEGEAKRMKAVQRL